VVKCPRKDAIVELTNIEVCNLRKRLYEEINKLPHLKERWAPELRDFEIVKKQILSEIAYKIWEAQGKPKNNDINIWLMAEDIWGFIRYMW